MAINGGNVSSTTTPALTNASAINLCTVPPGVCSVIIRNDSGATVYITAGVTATTSNGFGVATGASITIPMYAGSRGTTLSVIAGTAPTAGSPLSWLISSAQ